ncbi:MAG: hypothetical protein RLY71_3375 [Pseudomonadota bacterium]|jgi:energy-coupling factor transporter ATP-binding protein EcfA2
MYLRRLELTNFRGFAHLEWVIDDTEAPGWHVLLGPNGAGKSAFLKAAAIAMTGPNEFMSARRPVRDFIRRQDGISEAVISCTVMPGVSWDLTGSRGSPYKKAINAEMHLQADGLIKTTSSKSDAASKTIWGDGDGWFSAAFGPMRRFAGGNQENIRLFKDYPHLARHLSIFGEDVALTEALEWLRLLKFKQLESSNTEELSLLDQVRTFVNQPGFLPHGVCLGTINSEVVEFVDGNGVTLPVLELSDGFRAVLSMTFELLRLMSLRFPRRNVFDDSGLSVIAPGVVLIDEIDAHLHPSWQREVGHWFTRLFPNVQFIVTTHSPYVVQAAARGSVWALPAPGSDRQLLRLRGEQLNRVIYGDVLHVLNSSAFGGMPGRSDAAMAKMSEWANLKRLSAQGRIAPAKQSELAQLNELFGPLFVEATP